MNAEEYQKERNGEFIMPESIIIENKIWRELSHKKQIEIQKEIFEKDLTRTNFKNNLNQSAK